MVAPPRVVRPRPLLLLLQGPNQRLSGDRIVVGQRPLTGKGGHLGRPSRFALFAISQLCAACSRSGFRLRTRSLCSWFGSGPLGSLEWMSYV